MTEEERTDYALFELNKLLKYVVYPEDVACIYMEPVMGEDNYVTLPNETDLVDMVESALNTSASCLLYDTE